MIYFVVVDENGAVLRFGACAPDDLSLQFHVAAADRPELTPPFAALAFETDPGVTDVSHRYDFATQAFLPTETQEGDIA